MLRNTTRMKRENIIFIGAALLKRDGKKTRKYIYIRSIKVELNEIFPT